MPGLWQFVLILRRFFSELVMLTVSTRAHRPGVVLLTYLADTCGTGVVFFLTDASSSWMREEKDRTQ